MDETARKLDRTQVAMFVAAVIAAFFAGAFVQAVWVPIPTSQGAVYDTIARDNAAAAIKRVKDLEDVVRRDEDSFERVRRDLERHLNKPIGAPAQ